MPIEIGVVDDHPMYLDGAALWLERETAGAIRVTSVARTVPELLSRATPPVVLLDLRLADDSDPSANVSAVCATGGQVVVHSATESPDAVRAAVAAGACGYVAKSAPLAELVAAIGAAAQGEPYFTQRVAFAFLSDDPARRPTLAPREIDVLRGIAAGRTRAAVARSLGVSEATVKTYLERIRAKYRTAGRAAGTTVDLYQRAVEDGWISAAGRD